MKRYPLARLQSLRQEPKPMTEVNIIPVIDISLVLLVILFVTAPLLSVPNVPVELPRSSAPKTDESTIALTYTKSGELSLAARALDFADLSAALASEIVRRPEAPVVLRVDKTVPYRIVQRLIAAAKAAGAKSIALGTEPYK